MPDNECGKVIQISFGTAMAAGTEYETGGSSAALFALTDTGRIFRLDHPLNEDSPNHTWAEVRPLGK